MDKKQENEEEVAKESGEIVDDKLFDIATLKRRQEIYEKIHNRKMAAQNESDMAK